MIINFYYEIKTFYELLGIFASNQVKSPLTRPPKIEATIGITIFTISIISPIF